MEMETGDTDSKDCYIDPQLLRHIVLPYSEPPLSTSASQSGVRHCPLLALTGHSQVLSRPLDCLTWLRDWEPLTARLTVSSVSDCIYDFTTPTRFRFVLLAVNPRICFCLFLLVHSAREVPDWRLSQRSCNKMTILETIGLYVNININVKWHYVKSMGSMRTNELWLV